MKRAVILIAALILASASLRAETLKVMSFNMRTWTRDTDRGSEYFWRTRMEAMERMIEDIDPDIICFQEFLAPAGQYVPGRYRRVGVTASHPIYVRRGMESGRHGVSIYWDVCTVKGVRIFNIHSRWESDIIARTVEQVNARLSGRDIACGDWNNPLSVMDRNGLKMQSVRSILGVPEEDTFANFKRPEQSHGAIDHFFVNGVRAVSYRMVTDSYGCSKISDHYPIVAEIEI